MLELKGLHKKFGEVVAVDGLSLAVEAGEIFGLLGPNGAGKSTTMAMAVGLLEPDAGAVTLAGGDDPRDPTTRKRLGLAPQQLALYDELTGRENLEFFAAVYGLSGKQARARAGKLLEMVGLSDRAKHRVAGYSGGMKRRLNLAAALVHDPELLLLDEPTAGVDPQSRHAIFEVVRDLSARGKTVVYTTHYMEEAQSLCARVAIIDHGKLLALDTVDALIDAHGGDSALTVARRDGSTERISSADPLPQMAELAASADVESLKLDRPDLEGVFLNLTGRSLRD